MLGGSKVCGLCDVLQGVGAESWCSWVSGFSRVGTVLSQYMQFTLLPSTVPGLVSQRAEQIPLCELRTQSGA